VHRLNVTILQVFRALYIEFGDDNTDPKLVLRRSFNLRKQCHGARDLFRTVVQFQYVQVVDDVFFGGKYIGNGIFVGNLDSLHGFADSEKLGQEWERAGNRGNIRCKAKCVVVAVPVGPLDGRGVVQVADTFCPKFPVCSGVSVHETLSHEQTEYRVPWFHLGSRPSPGFVVAVFVFVVPATLVGNVVYLHVFVDPCLVVWVSHPLHQRANVCMLLPSPGQCNDIPTHCFAGGYCHCCCSIGLSVIGVGSGHGVGGRGGSHLDQFLSLVGVGGNGVVDVCYFSTGSGGGKASARGSVRGRDGARSWTRDIANGGQARGSGNCRSRFVMYQRRWVVFRVGWVGVFFC